MSEAEARTAPTRGRSSTRGGRAGFARGGPRGGRKVNGTSNDVLSIEESLDEQGELGEMKKKYLSELVMLKDVFPDWTDTDLVFALSEADGDVTATVDKITQGAVSQFAEVKKPKDRARSKVKDDIAAAGATDKHTLGARGTRGRGGLDGSRGSRTRGSDRGRGGHRGGRGGHATTNGISKEAGAESVPTTESAAWEATATTADESLDTSAADTTNSKAVIDTGSAAPASFAASQVASNAVHEGVKAKPVAEGPAKKSWASMFAKPAPAPVPVPPKQILTKQPPAARGVVSGSTSLPEPGTGPIETTAESVVEAPGAPVPDAMPSVPNVESDEQRVVVETHDVPAERPTTSESEGLVLTPPKDPLTEENVEHLPDESLPPATQTVASTAGSADPRNLTPLPSQQAPIGRPPMGGYAANASRLAGTGGRSASFQRRVQEQQKAVVMPGHNAVDRAAVQFGSMGLNGEPGVDVDDEREDPETRQPPQHSPPSQPRTSLPPVPRQTAATHEPSMPEAVPTPKQAPGLPPASVQNQQQIQDPSLTQGIPQDQHMNQAYNQYGRYGQPNMPQDATAQQQKQYDPFAHQAQHDQFNQYGALSQQSQQQAQSGFGGLSSAPSDYSSYYTSDQSRNAYNQYYGGAFGPQESRSQAGPPSGQHDAAVGQQRSASGFGVGQNDHAFASHAAQQAQSRFTETPGSGNNTPNPTMMNTQQQQQQSAQSAQQSQHSSHQAQAHQQGGYGASAAFPYGHPYYPSPYQQAYQNQFGYSQPGGGYGGSGFPGKQAGMYGAPHGYAMGSQTSYEQHSSSPANASGFSQTQQGSMRSASGMGSGLGGIEEYGRGSAQPASHQQSNAFGGVSDPFARSASGFGSQGYSQQSMSSGPEDSLKPFSESKGGPSPGVGQPGRPGSAANSAAGTSQSGLPPPQSQHSAFGGYPGFPGQGSQYGGLGGLGGHQQGQGGMGSQNAYGGYGGFSQYGSYGASRGGGWGANYNAH